MATLFGANEWLRADQEACSMPTIRQSVDVSVDVGTAYDQWTRFESFPHWMEGVVSVERVDRRRLHWIARVRSEFATVEGETREWDAVIKEQRRDECVSWESVGAKTGQKSDSGEASFEPLGDSACRVTFEMSWEPEGALETPGEVLAAVNQVVAADLERFKDFIEARAAETGSGRGEIHV
jgi:uncharacterized membrane protein